MSKIMLVIDNQDDQEFLEKVLERLSYTVISMKKGTDLSEQLIDHFPDVVFASTLGRNAKILSALGKIKQVRGKPKLVFVRQEKEGGGLSAEQKRIIDGVLYSPVDPFKLIDLLATTTEVDIVELRRRYNEMLASDRGGGSAPDSSEEEEELVTVQSPPEKGRKPESEYGVTQVLGKNRTAGATTIENDPDVKSIQTPVGSDDGSPSSESITVSGAEKASGSKTSGPLEAMNHAPEAPKTSREGGTYEKPTPKPPREGEPVSTPVPQGKPRGGVSSLISDEARKKKYQEWVEKLKANGPPPQPLDIQQLRQKQSMQSKEVQEKPEAKENRKHFLKTLFAMNLSDSKS